MLLAESGADGKSQVTDPDQYKIQLLSPWRSPGSALIVLLRRWRVAL